MSPKRKHYPKEFKVETVKLVIEGGFIATQVARELGISTNMLYRPDRGSQYASGDYQKEQESARNRTLLFCARFLINISQSISKT